MFFLICLLVHTFMRYHVKIKVISAGEIYAAASVLRILRHAVGDTYTLSHHRCKATVLVLLARKSVDLNGTHTNV
jgi:hypothetical protein